MQTQLDLSGLQMSLGFVALVLAGVTLISWRDKEAIWRPIGFALAAGMYLFSLIGDAAQIGSSVSGALGPTEGLLLYGPPLVLAVWAAALFLTGLSRYRRQNNDES